MQTASAASFVDVARDASARGALAAHSGDRLAGVADEFEALFIDIMLKAARKADSDGGLFDSHAMSTYREMLDHELARTLARHHDLGIGGALERQFGEMLGHAGDTAGSAGGMTGMPQPPVPRAPTGAPLAGTQEAFVARLRPHAERAAQRLGVSADAILAQAALETGWGEHVLRRADGTSAHNYFGIKADRNWSGDTVRVSTTEYVAGRAVTVAANFRAYPDAASAFADYASLLADNDRYRPALVAGSDTAAFARGLAAGGYATDPDYAAKIIRIAGAAGALKQQ